MGKKIQMKLSIIVPGIRNNLWEKLTKSIFSSCKDHSFEIIFVGPKPYDDYLSSIENVKYIQDFGSPSRSLQIGSLYASGEYITYTSDDCIARNNSLDELLNNINSDVVSIQYSESPNFSGKPHPIEYYNAWYHNDLRCKHVDKKWKIPIIFLMKRDLFYYYGGIDCKFEHINMNLHDLAFRMQMDNKSVEVSSNVVWDADYVHRNSSDPVIAAFLQNDKPLFDSIWNSDNFNRSSRINFNNWEESPKIWERRK
jgi:hypothetical protein